MVLNFIDSEVSVVNAVNSILHDAGILHSYYRVYWKTKDFEESFSGIATNYLILDLENAEDIDDIDDLCFNILEANTTPIIKLPTCEEQRAECIELFELYEVSYIDYEVLTLKNEPTVMGAFDTVLIEELLNYGNTTSQMHTPLKSVTQFNIVGDKIVISGEQREISMESLIDTMKYEDTDLMKNVLAKPSFISRNLPSPLPFILASDILEFLDRVKEYKIKMFYKATSLTPKEVSELPQHISNLYTNVHYIPLPELKERESEIMNVIQSKETYTACTTT